jgi:hypothetical protein
MRASFNRTYAADGYRYSVGARTKPVDVSDGTVGWVVEKWNGTHWVQVGVGRSYDEARTIASKG